jgi:hypothetical protein
MELIGPSQDLLGGKLRQQANLADAPPKVVASQKL